MSDKGKHEDDATVIKNFGKSIAEETVAALAKQEKLVQEVLARSRQPEPEVKRESPYTISDPNVVKVLSAVMARNRDGGGGFDAKGDRVSLKKL